jgi:hypothetical protein
VIGVRRVKGAWASRLWRGWSRAADGDGLGHGVAVGGGVKSNGRDAHSPLGAMLGSRRS